MALENGTMGWHLAGLEVARGAGDIAPPPTPAGLEKARACAARVAARFGVEMIDRETLATWQADDTRTLFLLDVRTPEEFSAGHLPGSRHAFGGQLVQGTDEFVGVRNARIVLIDDTEVRATMTASWLIQMGWPDVRILAGGLGADGTESGSPAAERPAPVAVEEIDAPALAAALNATDAPTVIDFDTSLAFRDGHVPGAWWAVRARLASDVERLPATDDIVVTSSDGAIGPYAAADIATLRPGARVRVLSGGTASWKAAGLPLESGTERFCGTPDDVQYKAYDNKGGVEEAMRASLSWETALVEQIARDGDTHFRTWPTD
ncbi:MAG: rhodanese-like domain-containing protein [Alphaproteobacteria bacterium]